MALKRKAESLENESAKEKEIEKYYISASRKISTCLEGLTSLATVNEVEILATILQIDISLKLSNYDDVYGYLDDLEILKNQNARSSEAIDIKRQGKIYVLGEIIKQSYHYLRMKFRLEMLNYLQESKKSSSISKKSFRIKDDRRSVKGPRLYSNDAMSEESVRSKFT
jgi:hypothetical protein